MASDEGEDRGGGGGERMRGRVERDIPNFLPHNLFLCARQLRGCKDAQSVFAELIKLWFNESLHQTKYFIVYAVTAAQILLTKFTDACCVILY